MICHGCKNDTYEICLEVSRKGKELPATDLSHRKRDESVVVI